MSTTTPSSPFPLASRSPWFGGEKVGIVASIPEVKQHPGYQAAKTGDPDAAIDLAGAFLSDDWLRVNAEQIRKQNPVIVSVHAVEGASSNMIAQGMGAVISRGLGLDLDSDILQINSAGHTGSSGWKRLSSQAIFDGPVISGRHYWIVDDFIGQGGTIANLRGHILAGGGYFAGATSLTGKEYSAIIGLSSETLRDLRQKHGDLEPWWKAQFGFGFETLTESEAKYLFRAEDADTIRARLAQGK